MCVTMFSKTSDAFLNELYFVFSLIHFFLYGQNLSIKLMILKGVLSWSEKSTHEISFNNCTNK